MAIARINEPMWQHTSFKVGGNVDIFFEPNSLDELLLVIQFIRKYGIEYNIIGNGSNLLVSDNGLSGAIIKIGDNMSDIIIDGCEVIAQSGVLLSTLSKTCAKNSLTGFEFASGIPGTLGGAIAMNAGAYGGEMKDVVKWVEILDQNLNIQRLDNSALKFGYRSSVIELNRYIVLRCALALKEGKKQDIDEIMNELSKKRKLKQPLHLPSAGSTFKRPEGNFAGKLIEEAGLKGYTIGGAQVSNMHCGFIVNIGNATANDIYRLIRYVQKKVKERFDIMLEPEVRILGKFEEVE